MKDNYEIKDMQDLKREFEKLSPEEKKIAQEFARFAQSQIDLSKKLLPEFDANDLD